MIEDAGTNPPAATVRVKVVPGARRDELVGPLGDRLKIRTSAPPEDGKANKAVCALVAAVAGVKARNVEVSSGRTSAEKTLLVRGITAADLRAALFSSAP